MKYITDKDKVYFKSLRPYIKIISIIFLLSVIYGVILTHYSLGNNIPQESNNYDYSVVDEKIASSYNNAYNKSNELSTYNNLSKFGKGLSIFKSNAFSVFIQSVFGIFYGIIPIYVTINNGIFLGSMWYLNILKYGFLIIIKRQIFHGIIEIPVIIISISIGLKLGYKMLLTFKTMIFSTKNYSKFKSVISFIISENKKDIYQSIIFYVKYIVPMLFISAFIEVYISHGININ